MIHNCSEFNVFAKAQDEIIISGVNFEILAESFEIIVNDIFASLYKRIRDPKANGCPNIFEESRYPDHK